VYVESRQLTQRDAASGYEVDLRLAATRCREPPIKSVVDEFVIGDVHSVVPAISTEIRRRRG
jgi:hypothetical protein